MLNALRTVTPDMILHCINTLIITKISVLFNRLYIWIVLAINIVRDFLFILCNSMGQAEVNGGLEGVRACVLLVNNNNNGNNGTPIKHPPYASTLH